MDSASVPVNTAPPKAGALAALASRFPPRQELFYVFGACIIPIFLWELLVFLNEIAGFALRLNLWDLVGMASYVVATALLEGVLLWLLLVMLAFILPARILKKRFVAPGSAIALISCAWMMYANYHTIDFSTWDATRWLIGLGLYLGSLVVALALIVRVPRVEQIVVAVVQRVSTLAAVYVFVGILGIVIVLIRNVLG